MSSTTAQEAAEYYMEGVCQIVGANEVIRHDQDPRFMSEIFLVPGHATESREGYTRVQIPIQRQQESAVQTVIQAVSAYVAERDQCDWDEQVEKLM
ncbi:unnamed protein product [Phytophthora fragariaefolia]|uniref:Unnamed protein product n=1 Tax=Phytophthora fragariaefolia TaxID=1490495 RepID=A0A9W7D0N6_9STRA|nr:unnamed protein product [Phytophthora fragariaefolia]